MLIATIVALLIPSAYADEPAPTIGTVQTGLYVGYRQSVDQLSVQADYLTGISPETDPPSVNMKATISLSEISVGRIAQYQDYFLDASGTLAIPLGRPLHALPRYTTSDQMIQVDRDYEVDFKIAATYKVGFIFDETILYGTIGYAIQKVRIVSTVTRTAPNTTARSAFDHYFQGAVIGGGLAIQIDGDATCTLEIAYTDYQNVSRNSSQLSLNERFEQTSLGASLSFIFHL